METLTCIALAGELDRLLRGMYVVLVEQADAGETLLIQLRRKKAESSTAFSGWLVLSSCMGDAVMFLDEQKPKLSARAWPAPLSDHIERMFVHSVSHSGMNRVIALNLSASPGGDDGPTLYVELFSARSRAYLAAPGTREVIEAFAPRREGGARSSVRGSAYAPPTPPEGGLDPMTSSAKAIGESVPSNATEDDLVGALFGVGRVLASEVLARCGASNRGPAEVLKEMLSQAAEGDAKGFIIAPFLTGQTEAEETPAGGTSRAPADRRAAGPAADLPAGINVRAPRAVPFKPCSLLYVETKACPTVNDAVRSAFSSCRRLALDIDRRRAASKVIRARLKRVVKTRLALDEELRETGRADEYRLKGELILAHIGMISKGPTAVELPHAEAAGGKLVVGLDPRLTPAGNAAAYFKRARKLQKKLSFLPGRIAELSRKEESLRSELAEVMAGKALAKAEPPTQRAQGQGQARDRWPPGVAPRKLLSSDGWTMYVGRNNRENDYVTFAFAKPDDLWFHAHGVAGSHVVLRRQGRKAMPSKRCIEETASVAAYFSKGRTSQTVAVIYTDKKYVRKPKKGKPGTALCSHEKTVMVAPALPPGPPTAGASG